ncbi:uncharacterized protein LOC133775900 isoform X1 [Lepus europaeus]|uniref:uncharacterized protein LOC133775900 isoform X1 n=1 Tax=Lepus europaeus TaxID=9983 RepID=UPI002B48BC2C|nr:uncharacterized protein LOC133775900 isoform X1 [Lepus europaeus]
MADEAARAAALSQQVLPLKTTEPTQVSREPPFLYSDQDLDTIQRLGAEYDEQIRVWRLGEKIVLPHQLAKEIITNLHQWTHLGHKKLKAALQEDRQSYYIPGLDSLVQQVTESCVPCAKVNARHLKLPEGARVRGDRPGINWEVNFTEIRPGSYGNKYLLVFVDTFSGWTEAFPTKRETARVVVKKIIEEILPQFGLPKARLRALQIIQNQVWKPLAAAYQPETTTIPHPFQIGDAVYVRRHQSKTLEPRWKGSFTVLLTTPTALKVDGIAAWVHASHVKRAPPPQGPEDPDRPAKWKLQRTQNPLKLRLSKTV